MKTKSRTIITILGLLFCVLCVKAQTVAPGDYRTITIDGDFSDWAGVSQVFAEDLPNVGPGSGGRLDFRNVYVANDDTYVYLRFTTYETLWVNWRFTVWVNGDTSDSNGFFSEGQPWKFRVIEGEGYQTVRANEDGPSQFNDGTMSSMFYEYTGGERQDVELRIALSTIYGSEQHPDSTPNGYFNQSAFPNQNFLFRIVGNDVDALADTTTVISYTVAAIPESSSTVWGFIAAAGAILLLRRSLRKRA